MFLEKLNPVVDRKYLIFLAGIVWCSAGMALIFFAISWLNSYEYNSQMIFYLAGFVAAILIHYFWFSRHAKKTLDKLMTNDKKKLFSFLTLESFLIIFVMVLLGIIMRRLTFPKQYISVLFNGIGLGLLFSGVRYIRTSLIMLYPGTPPER